MSIININIDVDKIEFDIYKIKDKEKIDILNDKIIIPKSFDIGEKLRYLRKLVIDIIKIYNIKKAYINVCDAIGMDIVITVKLEGVIEELLTDCGVMVWK